jgi:transposase InsO family protein
MELSMSWQEKDLMALRMEFVLLAIQEGANLSELCRRYQISRKTGYKWVKRYKEQQPLTDQSRRPHTSHNQVPEPMIDDIVQVRIKHPTWGARKIQAVLKKKNIENVPAKSSIHKVLKRQGYVEDSKATNHHVQRFEHEAPNHLWQMDFKGHFPYEKGRCHPLTILDDHSRFSIALTACTNERRETVSSILIDVFRMYGLPERINVDNGHPWGSLFAVARYTTLSVWLIRLGVQVSYSRPRHPQTNGKDERFHRTLKQEVLKGQYFRDIPHIQETFDKWRDIYNLERPHEGINMQVPGERYQVSYRKYPERLPEVVYSPDYNVHKVDKRGRIFIDGRTIFVGIPFSQEPLGVMASKEGNMMSIYYSHQKLGKLDISKVPKRSIINLYSKKTGVI